MKVIPISILEKYAKLEAELADFLGKEALHYMKIFNDGSGSIVFKGYLSADRAREFEKFAKKHKATYHFENQIITTAQGPRIESEHNFTPILTESEQAFQVDDEETTVADKETKEPKQ